MEDDSQTVTEDKNKGPDGRWLPGNNANPEGNNGRAAGWQPVGRRLQGWLEKPMGDLEDLAEDRTAIRKLSSIDAYCVKLIASGTTAAPKGMVSIFKEINDRIEGTSKQTIEHQGNPERPLYPDSTKTVTEAATQYRDAISGK
jgi:hypothetical protein